MVPLLKKLHEIRYDPDAIAKECEVSLILMVDRFLRKKLVSIDEEDQYGYEMSSHSKSTEVLKNMVYQLFRKIVEIGVWMLQDGDRIREKFIVILRKVLFANSEYAYFFENEGYHKITLLKTQEFKVPPPLDVDKLISTGELVYEITEQDDDASKIRRLLNYTQDENRDSKMDYNGHDDKIFKDSDCEESKDSDDVKPNDITGAKAYIETPGSRKLKGSSLYYGALYNHFCDLGGLRSIILDLKPRQRR